MKEMEPVSSLIEPTLVLSRVFEASRDRLFDLWTSPEHLVHWFSPERASMPYCTVDLRPGGVWHFLHKAADGEEVWVKGIYRQVNRPERIVYDDMFSDAEGNIVERPGFPRQTTITVTFEDHPRGTLVTIEHAGLLVDQGETQGWTEILDRLGRYLTEIREPRQS